MVQSSEGEPRPGAGPQADPRTVFVRGVSFGVDEAALEAAFSEVGPVRSCFLVRQKGAPRHRGYGFVQYALAEDAQRAAAQLAGTSLDGRKLQVETANKRAPLAERLKAKGQAKAAGGAGDGQQAGAEEGAQPDAAATPAAQATTQAPPQQAKQGQAREPAKKRQRVEQRTGEGIANQTKQRGANKRAKVALPAPAGLTPAQRERAAKQRLVRTLALGRLTAASKAQALEAAHAAGPVEEVVEPVAPADLQRAKLTADGCSGEVVYVVYASVKAALAAWAMLHGKVVPTATQALWARQVAGEGAHLKKWRLILRNLPFQVGEEAVRDLLRPAGLLWELTVPRNPDGKSRGFCFAGFTCRGDAEKAIKLVNGKLLAGRPVAVDWSVAKSEYAQAAHEPAKVPGVAAPEPGTDPDKEEVTAHAAAEDGDTPLVELPANEDNGEAAALEARDAEGGQQALDDKAVVQAALLRVLSEHEREEPATAQPPRQQAAAAKLASARKAADARLRSGSEASTRPEVDQQGATTVFVRGLPPDATQQQLHAKMAQYGSVKACRLVMDKVTRRPKGTAFVEFSAAADADKAAAASERGRSGAGPGVVLGGRSLEVHSALGAAAARQLAATKSGKPAPPDNRNLYLAKEGRIEEGSAAWQALSAGDQAKRRRAAEEVRLKLRSPNFLVSRTRLSLRNLPPSLDEKALRTLALQAVKQRATAAHPHIKQVKLLRDEKKVSPAGTPASRGMGFVEFSEHEHALCALRQLNNNPHLFGSERRPIVEFAIDNAKALHKRAQRLGRTVSGEKRPRDAENNNEARPAKTMRGSAKDNKTRTAQPQAAQRSARIDPGPQDHNGGQVQRHSKPKRVPQRKSMQPQEKHVNAAPASPTPPAARRRMPGLVQQRAASAQVHRGGKGDVAINQGKQTRNRKNEKLDNFEQLVGVYKRKMFGNGTAAKQSVARRWFE